MTTRQPPGGSRFGHHAAAARALTDIGVVPEQAAKRTRDGGGPIDTIAYKVANGGLTARQGAARTPSSRWRERVCLD